MESGRWNLLLLPLLAGPRYMDTGGPLSANRSIGRDKAAPNTGSVVRDRAALPAGWYGTEPHTNRSGRLKTLGFAIGKDW